MKVWDVWLPDDAASPGVLPDIEHYFGINDEKSGLLQTGENFEYSKV